MRGLVFHGDRRAELKDFPDPSPRDGEVVVAMRTAAICGSDVHYYRLPSTGPDAVRFQFIQGHEPSGVVAAVGPGVTYVKLGDRVSVYHYLGCGHCEPCYRGDYFYCEAGTRGYGWHVHGSMADFILTYERNCLVLPDQLSFVDGAFTACIAGTAYSALTKLGISGRDTLVVNGLGPLGLVMVMMARAAGARVIGVDPVRERIELASSAGANHLLDPTDTDVPQAVYDLTDGRGASAAFDSTGVPAANAACIKAMGYYGRAVFAGLSYLGEGVNLGSLDLGFMRKQLLLMGSSVFPIHLYWELVRFLIAHRIPLDTIVTHRFPIERGVEAIELANTGRCGKIIFEW